MLSECVVDNFKRKTSECVETPGAASTYSPFPSAAQMDSTKAFESKVSTEKESRHQLKACGIASLVSSLAFVVLLAMGVYFVLNICRSNANRANYIQSA
ncbi:hypothetical protein V6N13_083040 [Hibiscus sabdariffa]|uniref:Uncharacterized protein n=2 Tax=Hibiscus sabdariffa TaxID=183260 RepID=A0ABR2N709_9ROSI